MLIGVLLYMEGKFKMVCWLVEMLYGGFVKFKC